MKTTLAPACFVTATLRYFGPVTACIMFTAAMIACAGGGQDPAVDKRVPALEERMADQDAQVQKIEEDATKAESDLSSKKQWSKDKDEKSKLLEGTAQERTVSLVESSGDEVHCLDHPEREESSVLVMPDEFIDGATPLLVSLHGFGGDSAYQSAYVPLHERANSDGFARLLPNGARDANGYRFWNPTDHCCEGGKTGEDDVAFLTELVAEARKIGAFGPVYFFGYSNGGFMSHHMACKGLPGLRAVASLAGTSYVEDSSCEGAPPVSVLHIHGTADDVILFEGRRDRTGPEWRWRAGILRRGPRHGDALEHSRRLRVAGQSSTVRHPRSGRVRARRRNPGLPRGVWLRRGNQHRALDRQRQQPRTRLRGSLRGRSCKLALVSGVNSLIQPLDRRLAHCNLNIERRLILPGVEQVKRTLPIPATNFSA